ncbi:MAG TPA: hypothetical protein DCG49_08365 [Ruminococcus sp.]|nr:hypothetical protein [Ruminococcus sp.]
MKILFSPVGMTDPVSEEINRETKKLAAVHEGALLQICRHEQPDKVYLYFSQEACALEQKDHRYLGGLELLREELGLQFSVEVFERPELTEVHLFDAFLQEFRDILTKIRDEHPDAELLVNVSSGTPAMKSTLQILASASELNLKPLQVATWSYKPNHPRDCDIQKEWTLNTDREPTAPNRVTASANTNLLYEFNRKVLMKLIDEYDYHAAKTVSVQMRGLLPKKFTELLDAAALRSDAKFRDAQQKFRACGKEDLMPGTVQTAEYFLLLDIYVKKEKYTDFLRAMTPFILELFGGALKKMFGIDYRSYTRSNNPLMWDEMALKNSGLYGKFDQVAAYHQNDKKRHIPALPLPKGYVFSWHLTNLIENFADPKVDRQFVTQTIELRRIEEQIRNLAAHTMQGFSVAEFRRETNRSPQEMILLMRNYVRNYTDIPLSDDFLRSYQTMNDKLKSYL